MIAKDFPSVKDLHQMSCGSFMIMRAVARRRNRARDCRLRALCLPHRTRSSQTQIGGSVRVYSSRF
jgi:hypothetical protein